MRLFNATNRKNEINEFSWTINVDGGEIMQADAPNLVGDEFTIVPADGIKKGTYTMVVYKVGTEVKIVSQTREDSPHVTGKGICEAMLPELYDYYQMPIISSSAAMPVIDGECRVRNVTASYDEMASRQVVDYIRERDVYVFSRP